MNFLQRFLEPSSWAGLGLIAAGLGQVVDINEAPAVADAAGAVASSLSVSPTWQGLLMGAFGALSVILKERGAK